MKIDGFNQVGVIRAGGGLDFEAAIVEKRRDYHVVVDGDYAYIYEISGK